MIKVRREKESDKKRQKAADGMGYAYRLSVRVDQKHLDILDAVAEKHGESRNEIARKMIESFGKGAKERGLL